MAEQTFRSPGFYEREIDLSAPPITGPTGVPAGLIGAANKGPAFVPVTVANFGEFKSVFGDLDPKKLAPYAANEFLKNKQALTFLRTLGAGANSTTGDVETTLATGRVSNAGFKIEGILNGDGRHRGAVQFLTARHVLMASESVGMPMFTDNSSFSGNFVNLVRGMILLASGTRAMVLNGDASAVGAFAGPGPLDAASVVNGKFKLVLSSTLQTYAKIDGNPGVSILTASMDPSSPDYFAKILNTDPDQFGTAQHLLYADFAVDDQVASAQIVGVVSGSTKTSTTSGDDTLTMLKAYGAFDARYAAPSTTWFISQPFGTAEYDLFKFEALDDGEYANRLYKISISNLRVSLDDSNPYGTFDVLVRRFDDTDQSPVILEQFSNCSLDPNAANYVAKIVGDRKVFFNFDTSDATERRIAATGKYQNNSALVRIVVSDAVDRGLVPGKSLPFGFRGPEVLKTNDNFTDVPTTDVRLSAALGVTVASAMTGSIVPPIPYRFKVTRGEIPLAPAFAGDPGPTEATNPLLYWGVKFERNATATTDVRNANLISEPNPLISSMTKFLGIGKLDVFVTGSGADTLNNNKFTLANVALSNGTLTHLTSSTTAHMREAAYIRNARLNTTDYTVTDPTIGKRITLATMLAGLAPSDFNRFSQFAKFSTFMYGGYDGVNLLDPDARRLNDKSTSFDLDGGASSGFVPTGFPASQSGLGPDNNSVASYLTAVDVMTDPMVVDLNLLALPGIRESYVTDYAAQKVKDYGLAMYVMDIPSYDDQENRLYDDSPTRPDVDQTASAFDGRTYDNNYVATYFPDVVIDDQANTRRVKVPSSVAAYGALSFNDRIAYPWFAPAGFNRASLDFVKNVASRLDVTDQRRLQDSRINPIATFPREGWVIYGQKTLQLNKSALDRVNVRRLMLEVKRVIINIAKAIVFEQNTPQVRNKFVADSLLQLGSIQAQSGIEQFQVIMNETNNTDEDVRLNRLNGRIVVVPTRTIEFVAIDFIITTSGVQFV